VKTRLAILSVLAAAVLLVSACGTVAAVRPLHKGQSSLGLSFGGPVARVAGLDIPMPYAVARYRYGLNDQAGVYAGAHLLVATMGVVGLEGGISYHFLNQKSWIPTVGGSIGFVGLIRPGHPDQAFFPQLDLSASWLFADKVLAYVGSQSMYQVSDKPYVVLAPFVGGQVDLGPKFSLGAEAKWYAPTEPTKPRNVDYKLGIAGKGAVGFVLGAGYKFGGDHD
jgi:hypothetical protein